MTSEFEAATTVRRVADDRYDVELDPGWNIGDKPNGGYLMAVLARAGCDAVGGGHPLAVSGHFLRAPSSGPANVRVDVDRRGRRVSTVRATLWQNEKPCIDSLVSTGQLGPAAADWSDAVPPPMPPPEECSTDSSPNFEIALQRRIEWAIDPATAPFPMPSGEPVLRAWLRWRDGSPADVSSLLVMVDAMPPTVFNLGRYGWAPTVELTTLLRGVPAPGWLRIEIRTRYVAAGWFDEEATVWDSADRVVAQARQLALAGS